jgi:hypothetical protein
MDSQARDRGRRSKGRSRSGTPAPHAPWPAGRFQCARETTSEGGQVTPLRLRLDPTHDPARRRVTNEWNQALVHRLSLHLGTTGCRTRLDEGVWRGHPSGPGISWWLNAHAIEERTEGSRVALFDLRDVHKWLNGPEGRDDLPTGRACAVCVLERLAKRLDRCHGARQLSARPRFPARAVGACLRRLQHARRTATNAGPRTIFCVPPVRRWKKQRRYRPSTGAGVVVGNPAPSVR